MATERAGIPLLTPGHGNHAVHQLACEMLELPLRSCCNLNARELAKMGGQQRWDPIFLATNGD